jgi:hypothetical protein
MNDNVITIESSRWTTRQWFVVCALALSVFLFFAMFGPGADFLVGYRNLVVYPERLAEVPQNTWMLNPPWLAVIMAPFIAIPGKTGYIVFVAATLVMFIFGARRFGGRVILLLLSAQMMWVLWWGQIEGLGILALLIGLVALEKKSWFLMFLSLAVASVKPQLVLVPAAAIWWWSGKDRWKALLAMVTLVVFSIWAWGPWPLWYAQAILRFTSNGHSAIWNTSLGLVALPLYIPALLLSLNRQQRLIALIATTCIVSPYMPYYTTILLLCFAIPAWAYFFAFLGYFPNIIGTQLAWNAIVFLPLSVLVWLYWPILRSWLSRKTTPTPTD